MLWTLLALVLFCGNVFSVGNLPPTPVGHLTPPKQQTTLQSIKGNVIQKIHQGSKESKSQPSSLPKTPLTESLARWFLSGSDSKISSKPSQEGQLQNSVKKRQEKQIASSSNVKAYYLTAPGYSIISGHQGKELDNCNPCDRVPWVPMARALDGGSHAKVPQYALSVPTIQVAFPIKEIRYTIPVAHQKQQHPPQQFQSPHSPSGDNIEDVNVDYDKPEYAAPLGDYGSPPGEYGPPPPEYRPPASEYGPPSATHRPPRPLYYGKPIQELFPTQTGTHIPSYPLSFYNTQSLPQHIPNSQQLPSTNYGPPFSQGPKAPSNQYGPPSNANRPSLSYLPIAGAFGAMSKSPKNVNSSPPPTSYGSQSTQLNSQSSLSQHQSPSIKVPILIQNPIPFPLLSSNLIPPMYPYQQFNDGKIQYSDYIQTPKKSPQNVVTISEPNDNICRKCKEQSKLNDSEPSPAQHTVTEHSTPLQSPTSNYGSSQYKGNNQYNLKESTQFEVMKSIPLAEFLASVEYPMQIIQAPILDVPDLPKYFNLGFHNFPHLQHKFNEYKNPSNNNQKQPQTFSEQNIGHALFVNNGLQEHDSVKSSSVQPIVTASSTVPSPTTEPGNLENSLPTNHKQTINQHNVENITPSYLSSTNQLFQDNTMKPSQDFNINSEEASSNTGSGGSTPYQTATTVVDITPSLQTHSTGSTLPPTPYAVTLENELQLPSQNNPVQFLESFNTSSLDQQSNTFIQGEKVSNLQYLSPPPLISGSGTDWFLNSSPLPTLSPWASIPPRPFHLQTTHKPRFIVRPSPSPIKKPKQIHQIIVPYTTNKQTQQEFNQDLNNQGWTPLPPSNQGRKVPPTYSYGERLPTSGATASLNIEQSTEYQFPTGNDFKHSDSQLSKIPLSATGSDNVEELRFPNGHSSLNISPEIMNQLLKQWPQAGNSGVTGSGDIQHIIADNLQALLNGEEDSIDFARLQKNIDNWTAEGYKQNSPSVNFSPITTLTHLAPSKKIPEEYLTTETSFYNSTNHDAEDEYYKRSTLSPFDYEVSASQNHLVKAVSEPHSKFLYNSKENNNNESDIGLIQELNGWSLLETKMKSEISESKTLNNKSLTETTTEKNDPKEKLWEKISLSISPLTNEKVYVVTPLTYSERTTDTPLSTKNTSSISSSRVERSYSVQRSNKIEKVNHLPNSIITKANVKEDKLNLKEGSEIEGNFII